MAYKEMVVSGVGTVRLYRRRGNRSIRLSITSRGNVRISLPTWLPYKSGLIFLESKRKWISDQQQRLSPLLIHNQQIGKAHRLQFVPGSLASTTPKTQLKDNIITVTLPNNMFASHTSAQQLAHLAVRRALKKEADALLPQRLEILASQNGMEYRSVSTRALKSRWGSCNQLCDIVLNIYLVQLPWHLIDYVLLHELIHTRVLHHGPIFWSEFEKLLPNVQSLRKEIRQFQPHSYLQNLS